MDSTTFKGTIQGYLERSFQEMGEKEFKTPLAQSELGEKATLKENAGTFAQFRKWGDLPLDLATSGSESPNFYTESQEPSAPMTLSDEIFQVSVKELSGYISLRPKLLAQDPVDVLKKCKEKFAVWVRRMTHMVVNDRFVRPIDAAVTNLDSQYIAAPKPFRTIYAGGVAAFNALVADSFVSMADIFRGSAILRNSKAVPFKGGRYACVIDHAGIEQLKLGDSRFADLIKAFEDKNQKLFGLGEMIDYGGVYFVPQDDGYRCQLAAEGGALGTRKATGKVRVAHIIGRGAFGYLDFGKAGTVQRRTLTPKFKVQDITKTGTEITVAVRMAMQAMVLEQEKGLNLAYTSSFDEAVTDLPAALT